MHVNGVICIEKHGGTTWDTLHQSCFVRKVISKEVTAGGRFDFFLDSVKLLQYIGKTTMYQS